MTGCEGDQGTPAVDLASVKGGDQNGISEDDIVVVGYIYLVVFFFIINLFFFINIDFVRLVNSRGF